MHAPDMYLEVIYVAIAAHMPTGLSPHLKNSPVQIIMGLNVKQFLSFCRCLNF